MVLGELLLDGGKVHLRLLHLHLGVLLGLETLQLRLEFLLDRALQGVIGHLELLEVAFSLLELSAHLVNRRLVVVRALSSRLVLG